MCVCLYDLCDFLEIFTVSFCMSGRLFMLKFQMSDVLRPKTLLLYVDNNKMGILDKLYSKIPQILYK